SSVWESFTPLINNTSQFAIERANYGQYVHIDSSDPVYDPGIVWPVQASDLGFDYNAPIVYSQLNDLLASFRTGGEYATGLPVAAAQADVVAHSMGGVITRSMPFLIPGFYSPVNYLRGVVHKLITIGTPHLGSPLAIDVLAPNPQSECMASLQAAAGDFPF